MLFYFSLFYKLAGPSLYVVKLLEYKILQCVSREFSIQGQTSRQAKWRNSIAVIAVQEAAVGPHSGWTASASLLKFLIRVERFGSDTDGSKTQERVEAKCRRVRFRGVWS